MFFLNFIHMCQGSVGKDFTAASPTDQSLVSLSLIFLFTQFAFCFAWGNAFLLINGTIIDLAILFPISTSVQHRDCGRGRA